MLRRMVRSRLGTIAAYDRRRPSCPTPRPCELEAAGRTVAVSNPGKVFFPERGETKLDLIRYYLTVEPAGDARARRPARC